MSVSGRHEKEKYAALYCSCYCTPYIKNCMSSAYTVLEPILVLKVCIVPDPFYYYFFLFEDCDILLNKVNIGILVYMKTVFIGKFTILQVKPK